MGSNHRAPPYEGGALPLSYRTFEMVPSVRVERTCPWAPVSETGASAYSATRGCLGWPMGFEPMTFGVTFRCAAGCATATTTWSRRKDSNLRPSGPKPDALPAALRRDIWFPWLASIQRPRGYRPRALPLSYTRESEDEWKCGRESNPPRTDLQSVAQPLGYRTAMMAPRTRFERAPSGFVGRCSDSVELTRQENKLAPTEGLEPPTPAPSTQRSTR